MRHGGLSQESFVDVLGAAPPAKPLAWSILATSHHRSIINDVDDDISPRIYEYELLLYTMNTHRIPRG